VRERCKPGPGIELTKGRGLQDRVLVAYGNSSLVHSEVRINFDYGVFAMT
jgi:hypothetical protein